MRTTFIVTYDIADDKRLRRIFRLCKDYGNHLQFSVFECDLSPREKIEFEEKLKSQIKADKDQVLFIALGPALGRGDRVINSLGLPYSKFDSACFVV